DSLWSRRDFGRWIPSSTKMLPAVIGSFMAASLHETRARVRGMSQPYQRVTADLAITLPNVRPVDVLFQPEKNAQRAWVGALGEHDFVTFAECTASMSSAHHIRIPLFVQHFFRGSATVEISAC